MTPGEKLAVPPGTSPSLALIQLVQGYRVSEAISVAVKLGIMDRIADGPGKLDELARATGTHASSLYRLLRYLSTLGLLREDDAGNFVLTQLGELLRTGIPGSVSGFVRLFSEPWFQQPWNNLLYSVKTGEPAFDHVHGMGLFRYLSQHPDGEAVFNDAMSGGSANSSTAVIDAYDFSNLGVIIDVGGGHGRLLSEILKANPTARGVLFERTEVAEGAKKEIEASGLEGRCRTVAGDFFKEVPGGGDIYILRAVIHDWDDETCATILKNIRRGISPKGRLLLIEAVLPNQMAESPLDQIMASFDLNMMVITGGRERTANEFRSLLEAAGFQLTRIVPTEARNSIIEGTPA